MSDRWLQSYLKQGAVTALAFGNAYPVRATDREDVLALMRSLQPKANARGLIRMGPARDGGYLIPDDLEGIEACFSPGVGGIIGFEQDCVARGMKVFMADGSVNSPVAGNPSYSFVKKFVGAIQGGDFMTMDDWVHSSLPDSRADLLLQIDVEGFEYETFLSMSEALLRRFRVIAAEFHDLDQFWNRPFFRIASRAMQRILQTHTCVHIHPNNCTKLVEREGLSIPPVMEFTFLRNDRMQGESRAAQIPHPLDADNTDYPHLPLPACWYRAG